MIKPMLAYKVGKKEINYNDVVFLQPKLDGIRCVINKNGAFSRTGKRFHNVEHITDALEYFFKLHPNVTLDGELYNHNLRDDFEQIVSLVRIKNTTDETRLKSAEMIQYHVYDVYIDDKLNYDFRMKWISNFIPDILQPYIQTIETKRVSSEGVALAYHKHWLAAGYEGSILRLNKPYEQKRSYNLQKFKDFSDTEATIKGYVEGKGKRVGTLGKFIMVDDEGVEFGCPPGKGFDYDALTTMFNNVESYIGKRATFTYFQRTKAGSYRHPMFKVIRDYE